MKNQRAGERVMASVTRLLERKLKLEISESKSLVAPADRITFLGFIFKKGKIRWSDESLRQFKRQVKRLTGRSWFVSMDYRLHKLAQYIRGWINYYGISEYYRPITIFDHWLRRRVRMCYWEPWRKVRSRIKNLLKIGTKPGLAIPIC